MSISYYDIEELAADLLELSDEETDKAIDDGTLESLFDEEFGIGMDRFAHLVEKLLPRIPAARSGIGNTEFKGFLDRYGSRFLVKIEEEVGDAR